MVMKINKICISLLFILVFIFTVLSIEVSAETDKQRIYDDANILTDEEIVQLENIAKKYSEKKDTDFIIMTKDGSDGKDIEDVMDDFYDEEALGFDKPYGNTAMIGIDMKERDVVLMGFKKAETSLDPNRLEQIREKITPDLSDENYVNAFESFVKLSSKYMSYKPGVNPENPLFNTWVQLAVAVGIGFIVVWGMARNVEPKVSTTAATYRDTERTKLLHKRDRYIRTTVTKRRKPKQNKSSGSSGGGGSYGRTSGGHSRSSSRGKF